MNTDTKLLEEAKHSLILLIGMAGNINAAAPVLMKWPDALEAHLSNNNELFIRDMGVLMCVPIKIIAEALAEKAGEKNLLQEISETYSSLQKGQCAPIEAKSNLIRMCNAAIFKLRQKGDLTDYIKALGGEK